MFTWNFADRPAVCVVLADSWFMPPSPPAAHSDYVGPAASPPACGCHPAPGAGRRILPPATQQQSPASPPPPPLVLRTAATKPPAAASFGARRCLRAELESSSPVEASAGLARLSTNAVDVYPSGGL